MEYSINLYNEHMDLGRNKKVMQLRVKMNFSINNVALLSLSLLIICYWGFVDLVAFMRFTQILFFSSVGMIMFCRDKGKIHKYVYLKWAVIWMAICFASIIWSVNIDSTINKTISVFQVLLVGVGCAVVINSKRDLLLIEKSIVVAGVVLGLRLLFVTPLSAWGQDRLGVEIGMHVNSISVNLLISELIAMKLYFASRKKTKKRMVMYLVVSLLFVVLIFLSASKKSMILMIVGPLLMLLLGKEKVTNKVKNVAIILASVALLFSLIEYLPFSFDFATQRFVRALETFINGGMDASTGERYYLMKTALQTFSDNLILGVGLDGSKYFNTVRLYAHCNFLEIAADTGIIGFCIYYSLYFFIGYQCLKHRNIDVNFRYILIIMFCILSLEIFQITYFMESYQLFLSILCCEIYFSKHDEALLQQQESYTEGKILCAR